MLETLLDPVLSPLLRLGDFWAMLIITLVLSLLITLIYKYVTNQVMMKELKGDIKKLQQQSKEHRKNPEKMMKLQKEMMDKNMVLMKHSFKPTLITFLPMILIMGWLQSHIAYDPILPNQDFTVAVQTDKSYLGMITLLPTPGVEMLNGANQTATNGMAVFQLKAGEGLQTLQFQSGSTTFNADVRIGPGAHTPTIPIKQGSIKQVLVSYPKNIILDLGFLQLGWIGTYIVLSLLFSIGLRKLFRVY